MLRDDYLGIIRHEGEALLDAAATAPNAPIADCPGWQMGDLVYHIGEVHRFWARVVAERWTDYREEANPPRPDDAALIDWAREGLDTLEHTLTDADERAVIWTWAGPQPVAWVMRRMAHETVMHRFDAASAADTDQSIDAEIASDGIDEYLSYFLSSKPVEPGSVHLHATDAPGEWLVVFGDGDPVVTREHEKGDAALRGPAATLLLAIWQRAPIEHLDVIGDQSAVDRLLSIGMRG